MPQTQNNTNLFYATHPMPQPRNITLVIGQICVMREQEQNAYKSSDYLNSEKVTVSSSDRNALCNWAFAVCNNVQRSTAAVAFSYFDRFMGKSSIAAKQALTDIHDFQLAFVSCLVIALKVHSGFNVESDFVSNVVCSNMYDKEEIIEMEMHILQALEWRMSGPTPHDFIDRFIEVLPVMEDVHLDFLTRFSKALAEDALADYSMALQAPSSIAFASMFCALQCMDSISASVGDSILRCLETISGFSIQNPHTLDQCKKMVRLTQMFSSSSAESTVQ